MRKIFLSYKFTGEVLSELQETMAKITEALRDKGFEVFCTIESEEMYQQNKYTVAEMMKHATSELDQAEAMFVYNNSDNRSEGMLIEMGYALAKGKPIILAARKGININSSRSIAAKIIEFEHLEDLLEQIKQTEL